VNGVGEIHSWNDRRIKMQYLTELESTINDMVQKGRGVLATDESAPTITKRFKGTDKLSVTPVLTS
jgi:hypothetical protein